MVSLPTEFAIPSATKQFQKFDRREYGVLDVNASSGQPAIPKILETVDLPLSITN